VLRVMWRTSHYAYSPYDSPFQKPSVTRRRLFAFPIPCHQTPCSQSRHVLLPLLNAATPKSLIPLVTILYAGTKNKTERLNTGSKRAQNENHMYKSPLLTGGPIIVSCSMSTNTQKSRPPAQTLYSRAKRHIMQPKAIHLPDDFNSPFEQATPPAS